MYTGDLLPDRRSVVTTIDLKYHARTLALAVILPRFAMSRHPGALLSACAQTERQGHQAGRKDRSSSDLRQLYRNARGTAAKQSRSVSRASPRPGQCLLWPIPGCRGGRRSRVVGKHRTNRPRSTSRGYYAWVIAGGEDADVACVLHIQTVQLCRRGSHGRSRRRAAGANRPVNACWRATQALNACSTSTSAVAFCGKTPR
jgi:hypothetical protein